MEIVKQEVEIPAAAGTMPGYLARPATGGPYPTVFVIMEAFGLNHNIRHLTDRLAAEGFVALAPNLYYRLPNNVVGYNELPAALRLMASIKDDEVVSDVNAAVAYVKQLKGVKPKFGITGFCMGGRISFLSAGRIPDIGASVPFYGGGITAPAGGDKAPIDYVSGLKGPVLAFFGGKDAYIPLTDVEKVRAALAKAGKKAEIVVYDDADHGFMCEDRPSFHPVHAKEAWPKMVSFFKENLA